MNDFILSLSIFINDININSDQIMNMNKFIFLIYLPVSINIIFPG
jgi:hypothetical protein